MEFVAKKEIITNADGSIIEVVTMVEVEEKKKTSISNK